jgi:hypothetical protein
MDNVQKLVTLTIHYHHKPPELIYKSQYFDCRLPNLWGGTMPLTAPTNGPIAHPQVIYMSMEKYGDIVTWKTPDSFTRALRQSYQQSSSSKSGETWKGNYKFSLWSIFIHILKRFLHAVKSYDMGPWVLLPLRRKVCCESPLWCNDQWSAHLLLDTRFWVQTQPRQWILRAIKIRSTPSFRVEVKQSAPCGKILQHIKYHFEVLTKTLQKPTITSLRQLCCIYIALKDTYSRSSKPKYVFQNW